MRLAAVAAVIALTGCGGLPRASGALPASLANSSPLCSRVTLSQERSLAHLEVFEWTRDTGGVRPQPTGLTGRLASSAELQRSTLPGGGYVVRVAFDGPGGDLLDRVLGEAERWVPPDRYVPPEGHLGIFVGLSQDDLDHWATRQARLMRLPEDGGKLIDYPISLGPDGSETLVVNVGTDLVTGCSLSAAEAA